MLDASDLISLRLCAEPSASHTVVVVQALVQLVWPSISLHSFPIVLSSPILYGS